MNKLLQFCFDKLKINRLELIYVVANTRSQGLSKSLGFKEEGLLRKGYKLNEIYADLILASKLRTD